MRKLFVFLSLVIVMNVFVSGAGAAVISTYTGADAGEGLDLDGNFLYAVSGGDLNVNSPDYTIRDATFKDDYYNGQLILGVELYGGGLQPFNGEPALGSSTADNDMEAVLWSSALASGGGRFTYEMAVDSGQEYKLQLILSENAFGVTDTGTRSSIYDLYEGAYSTSPSVTYDSATVTLGTGYDRYQAVTMEFTAGSNDVTLEAFDNGSGQSPIINAWTLEVIPEPASAGFLLFGGMALIAFLRKRSRR